MLFLKMYSIAITLIIILFCLFNKNKKKNKKDIIGVIIIELPILIYLLFSYYE